MGNSPAMITAESTVDIPRSFRLHGELMPEQASSLRPIFLKNVDMRRSFRDTAAIGEDSLTSSTPPPATAQLFSRLYTRVLRVARSLMRRERRDHTSSPTDLVHDAFPRLHGPWQDESHFCSAAYLTMVRLLCEHARRRQQVKRGNGWRRVPLEESESVGSPTESIDLDPLHRALAELQGEAPRAAEVVRLRFFEGMTIDEIGERLGITSRTVDRDWRFASAYLMLAIEDGGGI